MLPADNQGAGGHFAFPDVCPTQVGPATVPIPYPNLSLNVMSAPSSPNILLTGAPALNMGSERPLTMGDNAAIPGTDMKPEVPVAGSPNVLWNGLPATTLTTPTTGNGMNCVGMKAVPSATNVFVNLAGAPAEADGVAWLRSLADALPRDGSALGDLAPRLAPGGLGVLRVAFFSRDVPARVHTAVRALEAQGMQALLLDLRGNPGGELDAFVALASDFLDPGTELCTLRDEDGDETVLRAHGGALYRFPLVLLIDHRTASAAELFAGCLQAHGRALLMGERTFGKGVGAACALVGTTPVVRRAVFVLPGGQALHGVGVTPDQTGA
jgi:carboxyl-terminal processing protease